MTKTFFLTLSVFLISGCARSPDVPAGSSPSFYDFSDFLDTLALNAALQSVNKTVIWRGQKESRTLEGYQWVADIRKFEDFDLNKSALYDKYEVDSLAGKSGELESIIYRSIDPKTEVKYFKVVFSDQRVDSIVIDHFRESFRASTKTHLTILPEIGYEVRLNEDRLFRDSAETKISLEILRDSI